MDGSTGLIWHRPALKSCCSIQFVVSQLQRSCLTDDDFMLLVEAFDKEMDNAQSRTIELFNAHAQWIHNSPMTPSRWLVNGVPANHDISGFLVAAHRKKNPKKPSVYMTSKQSL